MFYYPKAQFCALLTLLWFCCSSLISQGQEFPFIIEKDATGNNLWGCEDVDVSEKLRIGFFTSTKRKIFSTGSGIYWFHADQINPSMSIRRCELVGLPTEFDTPSFTGMKVVDVSQGVERKTLVFVTNPGKECCQLLCFKVRDQKNGDTLMYLDYVPDLSISHEALKRANDVDVDMKNKLVVITNPNFGFAESAAVIELNDDFSAFKGNVTMIQDLPAKYVGGVVFIHDTLYLSSFNHGRIYCKAVADFKRDQWSFKESELFADLVFTDNLNYDSNKDLLVTTDPRSPIRLLLKLVGSKGRLSLFRSTSYAVNVNMKTGQVTYSNALRKDTRRIDQRVALASCTKRVNNEHFAVGQIVAKGITFFHENQILSFSMGEQAVKDTLISGNANENECTEINQSNKTKEIVEWDKETKSYTVHEPYSVHDANCALLNKREKNLDFSKEMLELSVPGTASGAGITEYKKYFRGIEKKSYLLNAESCVPIPFLQTKKFMLTAHFIPQFKVRIFQDDPAVGDTSKPVRTPSAMPGIHVMGSFPRLWKRMHHGDPNKLSSWFFALNAYHHSNGQDNPEFVTSQFTMAVANNGLYKPGEINSYNGNFSEMIVLEPAIGFIRHWNGKSFRPMGLRKQNARSRTIKLYDANSINREISIRFGYDWHPNVWTNEVIAAYDLYGRNRLHFTSTFRLLPTYRDLLRMADGKYHFVTASEKKESWRFVLDMLYITDKVYNIGDMNEQTRTNAIDIRRFNAVLTVHRRIPGTNNASFFIEGSYVATDLYNMYFQNSFISIRGGIGFGFFKYPKSGDLK